MGASTAPDSAARIERQDLTEAIVAAIANGSLLARAPAGYGKTESLAAALATARLDVAALTLTPAERDAGRLFVRIAAALRESVPGLADVLVERIESGIDPVDAERAAEALTAELADLLVDPLVLMIDEAEHVSDSAAGARVIERLLAAGSRSPLRVVIASRHGPDLRTARLEAAGQLATLGAADLAFTPAECAELLSAVRGGQPTEADVDEVMVATEGWPLGVALLARRNPVRPSATRTTGGLAAFIEEEILAELPVEMRRALTLAALADELSPAVADALGLPAGFAGEPLRLGLPARTTEPDGTTLVLHPLLREALAAGAGRELEPGELAAAHVALAEEAAGRGRAADAVEHWLAAGRDAHALEAIAAAGPVLLRTSPDLIARWLGRISDDVRATPRGRLLAGQLEWAHGSHERAIAPLRDAVAGFAEAGDVLGEWSARLALSDALSSIGDTGEMIALAEGFDEPETADAGPIAPAVAIFAAIGHGMLGDLESAERICERALANPAAAGLEAFTLIPIGYAATPAGDIEGWLRRADDAIAELERFDPLNRIAYCVALRAMALDELTREDDALGAWRRLDQIARANGLGGYVADISHAYAAFIHARAGRLGEAEAELARGGEPAGAGWRAWKVWAARAAVAAGRGDARAALRAVETTIEIVRPGPVVDRFWAAADLAPVLVEIGAPRRARELIDEGLAMIDELLPGPRGAYVRARLLAIRAWLCHSVGDEDAWRADLLAFWDEAPAADLAHLLRREWPHVEPLLWSALAENVLPAEQAMAAVERALPGGPELVELTRHPLPAVRAAAIGPALASGHPQAGERLTELERDPEPAVSSAAAAAGELAALAPPPMTLTLLGGFSLRRGQWRVEESAWGRRIAERLVRFLAVNRPEPVPEDMIFEALWPDRSADSARRSLQVALSSARRVLDPPRAQQTSIEATDRHYRLAGAGGLSVDSEHFEQLAREALADHSESRRRLLERAEQAWGGEPLPEERYAEWAISWREHLHDVRAGVLAALADSHATGGDPVSAMIAARELVAIDPLDEGSQRRLMVAYSRAGRRGHALRQFLECRRALVTELGVEPAAETVELHRKLLEGEPA